MAQLYGRMMGDAVLASGYPSAGVPVVTADAPEAPEGYRAASKWVDAGTEIRQAWEIVPEEGTAAEASVALARMQAESLDDERALKVVALYPQWWQGEPEYAAGQRLVYAGALYKVLQTHKPSAEWTPDKATSLYARVLPGQSGEVAEWVRPGASEGYSKGDRVTHSGKTWESLIDANVHEPGTDNGNAWKEVAA